MDYTARNKDSRLEYIDLSVFPNGVENYPARDEAMSKRVRELYNGKSRLVAIVGLGHLSGLKTKLEDLDPIVMNLGNW